jgi:hypothetical protein
MRSHMPAFLLYLGVFFACIGLAAAPAACTKNQRVNTIQTSLVAVNVARDGFTAWDLQHQSAIVDAASSRDEAEQKIAAYKAARDPVIAGFEIAYRALAMAATQTDDSSLAVALKASSDLFLAVKQLRGGT